MDNYQANRACRCNRCISHGIMGPVVLITLGILFLLGEFHLARFSHTWPILLIVIGLVKVLGSTLDTTGHLEPPDAPAVTPLPPAPTAPGEQARDENPKQVEHV